MTHKDDYIIHKSIQKDDKKGTVTLSVVFRVAEKPRNRNIKTYNTSDARRWLEEGGIKVEGVIKSCTTSNYIGGQPAGTRPQGVWVFELYQEPKKSAPKKKTSKPKQAAKPKQADSVTEAAKIIASEFDGLNYDGDNIEQPTVKKTSKRKRKSKTTTNEE